MSVSVSEHSVAVWKRNYWSFESKASESGPWLSGRIAAFGSEARSDTGSSLVTGMSFSSSGKKFFSLRTELGVLEGV